MDRWEWKVRSIEGKLSLEGTLHRTGMMNVRYITPVPFLLPA